MAPRPPPQSLPPLPPPLGSLSLLTLKVDLKLQHLDLWASLHGQVPALLDWDLGTESYLASTTAHLPLAEQNRECLGGEGEGRPPGGSWGAGRQLPAPAGALPALRPPPLSPGAPAPSPLLGRVTPGRWPRLKARGAQGSGPGTAPFHSTHPPRPLPGLSRPPRPSFQDAYRHLAHYLFY